MDKGIKTEWVIGTFTGDRATSVKQHADAGLGYFVRKVEGRGQNFTVTAAFRRACDSPMPEHLETCNSYEIDKLEALFERRHGNGEKR